MYSILRNYLQIVSLLTLVFLYSSCKDKSVEPQKTPKTPKISTSTILVKDEVNIILGEYDSNPADGFNKPVDDWHLRDDLVGEESKVFNNNLSICEDSIGTVGVYANPIVERAYFYFSNMNKKLDIELKVVDSELNLLWGEKAQTDSLEGIYYKIISKEEISKGNNEVRIYYKIKNGDCVLIGHGDLHFNPIH